MADKVDKVDVAKVDAIDWANVDAAKQAFHAIGASVSPAGVFATIVLMVWAFGEYLRKIKHNGAVDVSPFMDAFVAARKLPGGGGAISGDTEITYRSVAKTCAEVAKSLSYDGRSIAAFIGTKLGGVGFGSRAAIISEIATAYPSECPTTDQMTEILKARMVPDNVSDIVSSIVKRIAAIAADNDTASVIAKHNLNERFRSLNSAAKALLEDLEKAGVKVTPPKRKGKSVSDLAKALLS